MRKMQLATMLLSVLCLALSGTAHANLLANPGFEQGDASGGDIGGAAGWMSFNSNFTTQSVPAHGGVQTLKQFGPFNASFDAAGSFQNFAVAPGDLVAFSAFARNDSSDPIQMGANGGNFAVVKLEFLDPANNILDAAETQAADFNSPRDVWLPSAVAGVAPAGATQVNALLLHVTDGSFAGGSVFWDDAILTISAVPEPSTVALLGAATVSLCVLYRRRK